MSEKQIRDRPTWMQWSHLQEEEGERQGGFADVMGLYGRLAGLHERNFEVLAEAGVLVVAPAPSREARIIEEQLRAAFGYGEKLDKLCGSIARIEVLLNTVLETLNQAEQRTRPLWVPIESFAPEPYEVLKPFTAVVVEAEDGFESSFFDANIHAYGDTEEEAISNLKSAVLDAYDHLFRLEENQLGPGPAKQRRVLVIHIRKIDRPVP